MRFKHRGVSVYVTFNSAREGRWADLVKSSTDLSSLSTVKTISSEITTTDEELTGVRKRGGGQRERVRERQ